MYINVFVLKTVLPFLSLRVRIKYNEFAIIHQFKIVYTDWVIFSYATILIIQINLILSVFSNILQGLT